MFRGRFDHIIDGKSRLSIPSRFREVLTQTYGDERLIVTNFDGCLWAYPVREWERIEKRVGELPQFKKEVKAIQRLFISAATECSIDKLGRLLLPTNLRAYANLERDVVIVGMTRRIEMWDKGRWESEIRQAQAGINWEALGEFDL